MKTEGKKVRVFVSYHFRTKDGGFGVGNCSLDLNKIDIRDMEEFIETTEKSYQSVIILFFKEIN